MDSFGERLREAEELCRLHLGRWASIGVSLVLFLALLHSLKENFFFLLLPITPLEGSEPLLWLFLFLLFFILPMGFALLLIYALSRFLVGKLRLGGECSFHHFSMKDGEVFYKGRRVVKAFAQESSLWLREGFVLEDGQEVMMPASYFLLCPFVEHKYKRYVRYHGWVEDEWCSSKREHLLKLLTNQGVWAAASFALLLALLLRLFGLL